jgi:Na+-transporting methylmalonyl-CoA/oxaloacetate decarboxylase gamma subunit
MGLWRGNLCFWTIFEDADNLISIPPEVGSATRMYSAFGLYLSVVGIALVFATLLAIGLLSEVTRRVFRIREETTDSEVKLAKVVATAAVLMLTESEPTQKVRPDPSKGDELWKAAARIEALDGGIGQEK